MIKINGSMMKNLSTKTKIQTILDYQDLATELDRPGVYKICLCDEVVYIGQSRCLFLRLLEHCSMLFSNEIADRDMNQKYMILKNFYTKLSWSVIEYTTEEDLCEIEDKYIIHYSPIFNITTPVGQRYFIGTVDDISDFVTGVQTMEYLKTLVTSTKKKQEIIEQESCQTSTTYEIEILHEAKALIANNEALNKKVIQFYEDEVKRTQQPCMVKVNFENDQIVAKSFLPNQRCVGQCLIPISKKKVTHRND